MVFLKEFFKKVDLVKKKKQQTTEKHEKIPSLQRVYNEPIACSLVWSLAAWTQYTLYLVRGARDSEDPFQMSSGLTRTERLFQARPRNETMPVIVDAIRYINAELTAFQPSGTAFLHTLFGTLWRCILINLKSASSL